MLLCTFSVTDANDQIIITCLIQAPMDSFFNLVPVKAPTFAIWVKASVTLDSASSLSSLTSSALTTDGPRIPLPKRSLFPYLTSLRRSFREFPEHLRLFPTQPSSRRHLVYSPLLTLT
ncbi:hypothetical protein DPMN_190760 [Dreissena polymorpha]|uniref:Uncharacterized protein n=1 Tax=Dreissena polymorpha TaxID=45954 RepID=A0A9D4BDT1_DREPO|nr:hypothetical protein DPMN_190760 [Dreissena polymorpha]